MSINNKSTNSVATAPTDGASNMQRDFDIESGLSDLSLAPSSSEIRVITNLKPKPKPAVHQVKITVSRKSSRKRKARDGDGSNSSYGGYNGGTQGGVVYYPTQSVCDSVLWLRSVDGVPTYRGVKAFYTFDEYGYNPFKLMYLVFILWPMCLLLQVLCLPFFPLLILSYFIGCCKLRRCCSLRFSQDLKAAHNSKNWMRTLHILIAEVVLCLTLRSWFYVGDYNMYWLGHGVFVLIYLMFRLYAVFQNTVLRKLVAIALVLGLLGWHYRFDFSMLPSAAVGLTTVDYEGIYQNFDPSIAYHTVYTSLVEAMQTAWSYDYAQSKYRHHRDTMLNWAILGLVSLTALQVVVESGKCLVMSLFHCCCCRCHAKVKPSGVLKEVEYKDEECPSDDEQGSIFDDEEVGPGGGLTVLQPMEHVPSVFNCVEREQMSWLPPLPTEADYDVESVFTFIPKGPPTPLPEHAELGIYQMEPEPAHMIDFNVPSVFSFIPKPPVYTIDYNVPSIFNFIPAPPSTTVDDVQPFDELELDLREGEVGDGSLNAHGDQGSIIEGEEEPQSSFVEERPPTPEPDPPTPEELRAFSASAERIVSDLHSLRQTAVASVYKAQQQVTHLFAADCWVLYDKMKDHVAQLKSFQEEMTSSAAQGGKLATKLWLAQHSAPPKRARRARTDYFKLQETATLAAEKCAYLERELEELMLQAQHALHTNIELIETLQSKHEGPSSQLGMVCVDAPNVSLVVRGSTSKEPAGAVGPDGQISRLFSEPLTDVGGTWNGIRLPRVVYGARSIKPSPKSKEEIEEEALLEHKATVMSEIKALLEARRVVEQAAADKEAAYVARFNRKPGCY